MKYSLILCCAADLFAGDLGANKTLQRRELSVLLEKLKLSLQTKTGYGRHES